jgi:hypothetical protein
MMKFDNVSDVMDMFDVVSKKEKYWGGARFSIYKVIMETKNSITKQFHIGIGKRIFMFAIIESKKREIQ